jgi:large subunit ribosomal protein L29
MKTAELRAKSKEELNEMVMSLKKERFNLRFQAATGVLENRLRFREVKKTIARAKTVLNEQPGSVKPKAGKPAKASAKKKTVKAKKEE